MQKIIYVQDHKGHKIRDIDTVSSNVAYGLIDKGVAKIYSREIHKLLDRAAKIERKKILRRPPMDKMMRMGESEEPKGKKDKKGRYITK